MFNFSFYLNRQKSHSDHRSVRAAWAGRCACFRYYSFNYICQVEYANLEDGVLQCLLLLLRVFSHRGILKYGLGEFKSLK